MDHPGQLCRLCAQSCTSTEIQYLFNDGGQGTNDDDEEDEISTLNLVELINMSLPIQVSRTDHLPKQVCHRCVEKVRASCEFAVGCLTAEQELEKMCEENKFRSETIHAKNDAVIDFMKPFLTEADLQVALESTDPIEPRDAEEDPKMADVSYCCPLCYEGQMAHTEATPSPETPDCSTEQDVLEDYHRANNASDSEDSFMDEDFSDMDEKTELEAAEFSVDDPEALGDGELLSKSEPDETVFIDDENDEDYPDPREQKSKRKRFGHGRGRGRGRGLKRGRGRGRPKGSGLKKEREDDTLIWVDEESQQSVPLVQCVKCSGWLPGFAACLQHTLASHVQVDEENRKSVDCSRCEVRPFESEAGLVEHFFEKHCAELEVSVAQDGTFNILDTSPRKMSRDGRRIRDVAYHCTICERGFSWLLSLLRHSCLPVDCSKLYCEECQKPYSNRQRYVFHKQFHGPNTPTLECDVCSQAFTTDSTLYDHVRFAHLEENVVCDECGKHFRSEKGLVSHQQSAHSHDPAILNRHKCPDCGKGYKDKQGLREHMVTHLSEKPFPCNKCDRAYNRYSRLKQHQLTHVYTESMDCFECLACGMAFSTEETAVEHSQKEEHPVKTTTLSKVYRCEYCDSLFSGADGLNQHRLFHDGTEKPFTCHICGAAFHSYSRVTTHKTTHGIYDQIEPRENDFTIPKHFLCEVCGLSYLYWSYLRTHRRMRHSDNPYVISCKFCPEKFKNSWSAVYHRKKVHDGGGAAKEWRQKTLTCPHCGNHYMYQHTLDIHIEKKHGTQPEGERESYQCEECGKVFKYQSSLVLHQKMHMGQKSFLCEECNKGFLTIATWRNHMKRCHEGIRPHKCDYCDKAFFHKATKDDHMRVHTGEKPFECQYCHKSFRLKSMLADHAKIHNDDRPYPCDICGTSFRRMVHMKQHRMLHTGERPYQCTICNQDFRLKQELQRHLKAKHTDTPEIEEDFLFTE